MPGNEGPEQRLERRKAIRVLSRLAQSCLASPEGLRRDAGRAVIVDVVGKLNEALQDPEERAALREAVAAFGTATGESFPDIPPLPLQAGPGPDARPENTQNENFRVHNCDVQLTYNCSAWVPLDSTVSEWWPSGGVALATGLQRWAVEEFPRRFRERLSHTTLTIEESLRSRRPQVHIHGHFTFKSRIDRTGIVDFMFGPHTPHIETNSARGKDVAVARARAHFYVACKKEGTLWVYTDWAPFVDYEVNPHWLTGWWALGKLSHEQYKRYLLQCRRSFKAMVTNLEAVVLAEKQEALIDFQEVVVGKINATKLPFRGLDDPLFPQLSAFFQQFEYAKERYAIYALQGPSQAAKTSFAKSLFRNPFVITVQGEALLDLRAFVYGSHDAVIIDNLVSFDLILKYRALLQSNTDLHRLGESTTGIYSYTVFLWAVPVLVTLDIDVDTAPYFRSDWLQTNVLLDSLSQGSKCYVDGARPLVNMRDMPCLKTQRQLC
jgi:hypothetical protein